MTVDKANLIDFADIGVTIADETLKGIDEIFGGGSDLP